MKFIFVVMISTFLPIVANAQILKDEKKPTIDDRYDPGAHTDFTPDWKKEREEEKAEVRKDAFGGNKSDLDSYGRVNPSNDDQDNPYRIK